MINFPGFEPQYIDIDEAVQLNKKYISSEAQVIYVIATSFHAVVIMAVQIWKRSKGIRLGMIYPLESDAIKAYENQPMPMRKRYFPFKVHINGQGFVMEVEQFNNKPFDRNKNRL